MRRYLSHPFWQGAIVVVASYVAFEYVIGYVLPVVGVASAPVPSSVIVEYMLIVLVGILLYMSADEERWQRFREPIQATMVQPGRRTLRGILMVAIPVLIGWLAYERGQPGCGAPAS